MTNELSFAILSFFFSQKVLQSTIISYSMHSLWYVKLIPGTQLTCSHLSLELSSEIFYIFYLQVLKESFKVYCAINEGIINLVEKVGSVFSSPSEVTRSLHVVFAFSLSHIYAYIAVL